MHVREHLCPGIGSSESLKSFFLFPAGQVNSKAIELLSDDTISMWLQGESRA